MDANKIFVTLSRYFFTLKNLLFIYLNCSTKNRISINRDVILRDCIFQFNGKDNYIRVESGCILKGLHIYCEGNNNFIHIGRKTIINATKKAPTIMNAIEGTQIIIGSNCLFSNNIEIHTSDYHSILNQQGERINPAKSINIGNHVWIGLKCIILKGATIKENSIVAAGSIVNKQFYDNNILIAGHPATIKKQGVNWTKEKLRTKDEEN